MKRHITPRGQLGFTLIELLVVIAIITVLAGLIIPIVGALKNQQMRRVAEAERDEIQTAIDSYKAKLGYFPPDNPGNPMINPLFYELEGTILAPNGNYSTRDSSSTIPQLSLPGVFNSSFTGFMNSSKNAAGDDQSGSSINFLKNSLKPTQVGQFTVGGRSITLLLCSVKWADQSTQPLPGTDGFNPWRYVSTGATNNRGSYDLWVDVLIGHKTNRISNWSRKPQVL